MSSPSARPTPLPERAGSTMKLAEAMCEPLPAWLGFILALPRTVPSSSTATAVRPGGGSIQRARASGSVRSSG